MAHGLGSWIVAGALIGLLAARGAAQQDRAGWFPFTITDLADPETAASSIDLSFLSPEPAGAHGFLRPQGEELVDDRGVPIRLFGSNLTDYHPMPDKAVAGPVAERLRQLGINFIRLHYFDWDIAPKGILNPDRQTLNPEKLDQLDWLIASLKRCGVYVDLNLHVARGYANMPPGWDWMGKSLDIVHQPYIESQKQYARDLLTHVNPYTGNAYTHEPAIAIIELNNENTALGNWQAYAGLPPEFAQPLQQRWNTFLREKYRATDALARAWNANPPHGPELLRNADLTAGTDGWTLQNSGGAESALIVGEEGDLRLLQWTATQPGSQGWHLQFFQPSVPVRHGGEVALSFRARADAPAVLRVGLMTQQAPWATVGTTAELRLTADWRDYEIAWTVRNPGDAPVRLNFDCDNAVGVYRLTGLSLREGGLIALKEGQRLEDGSVPLVASPGGRMRDADYMAFLMAEELRYAGEMRALIKGELGAQSILFDTQVSYGGLAGLVRESATGDVIDCHAYPSHPLRSPDGRSWSVRNVSMLDGAFAGLPQLALHRVAGKPFCVTEFDLNPPNDHASECFPFLALMGAYQGWSCLADYVWHNFGTGPGTDRLNSYFATVGHPGQMAFVPTAALLFRQRLVRPAEGRLVLDVPADEVPQALAAGEGAWTPNVWARAGVDVEVPWVTGVATRLAPGGGAPSVGGDLTVPQGLLVSDTGEIALDRREIGRETLTVNAPAVRLLMGRVAGRAFDVGDVAFEVAEGPFRNYANLALVALDGRAIGESRKLLLTVVARTENAGQVWNAERTAVEWGDGPVLAEPVTARVTLPTGGWRARGLDGKGCPQADAPLAGRTLTVEGRHATLWYLLER
ncbi:MAG: hypothetical protein FJX74_11970 [Armatimonadetes bacterium]|nr:hypothetical protein [Armatimonadota bacterium]